MKRTGEIVLGIIGIVLYALMTAGGIFLLSLQGNEQFQQALQDSAANNPGMKSGNVNAMLESASSGATPLLIASIIGFILGLAAVILIKGNKKPKLAGILFIVGGALSVLISGGSGFLAGILYVIAGIMALARKPKHPVTEDGY